MRIVCVTRNSFMLECFEPSAESTNGLPVLGPSSSNASTEATTLRCSGSVRVFHQRSNSAVLSALQLMPRGEV